MTLCPIALAAGCQKCPVFKICPLKNIIGDQPAATIAAPEPVVKKFVAPTATRSSPPKRTPAKKPAVKKPVAKSALTPVVKPAVKSTAKPAVKLAAKPTVAKKPASPKK